MNLTELVTTYNNTLHQLKKEMSEKFQSELKTVFKAVFEQYPAVTKMCWTQYTPYFNDGDPCVFNVHDLYVFDDTVEEDSDYYDGVDVSWGEGKEQYPEIAQISKNLSAADDLLLEMFGDHCQIIVTRDGITVEEYEHD
jgi:L-ribulose-5-phosphate 3-epimerase UlaE